jgi:hypothetical protein
MSRKQRNKKVEIATNPSAAAVAPPPRVEARPAPAASKRPEKAEQTWLEVWLRRIARPLGSLQMAVILLAVFAGVLAIGTVAESRYNGRVAQELVYRAWWFTALLFLLSINIFFAAAKKWPWKKHQTGFLITHVGLLTMLAGGIWGSLSGTDAMVQLVDTKDPSLRKELGPNSTTSMILTDVQAIRVLRHSKDSEVRSFDFSPGSFPWHSDQYLEIERHPLLSLLCRLASPLNPHWSKDLGGGAVLTVKNFYPHCRSEPYSPANGGEGSFPALKIQLNSKRGMRPPAFWLALSDKRGENRDWPHSLAMEPAFVEFLGPCPPELIGEFLEPPSPEQIGPQGTLVVAVDGQVHRLPVQASLGQLLQMGTSGQKLRITSYVPTVQDDGKREPTDPAVYFDFTDAGGNTQSYRATARFVTRGGPVGAKGTPAEHPAASLKWWYHPPDFRYGTNPKDLLGLLQFAQGADGKIYYRTFHQDAGAFRRETSGIALERPLASGLKSEVIPIWKQMKWEFQIVEFLPSAAEESRLVPENARPGLERRDLDAAIRCELRNKNDTKEFWVRLRGHETISVGGESFSIGYSEKTRPLGFEIKLLRAEQQVDAGTDSAATFTSFVQVTDEGAFSSPIIPAFLRPITNFVGLTQGGVKADSQDHVITMNEPLNWHGYKLYQSELRESGRVDSRQRPINFSGLTVGRDPGMFLKYLGSSMLALGIVCMFYMKAYFFKPRGRSPPVSANGTLAKEEGK